MLGITRGVSVYMDMYIWGLKGIDLSDIQVEAAAAGVELRDKDIRNYYNGYYKRELNNSCGPSLFSTRIVENKQPANRVLRYSEYPEHPYAGQPENMVRFVPCNSSNKPIIKWSKGCMTYTDARAWPNFEYLAENVKGCQFVVIDIDGDHSKDNLDLQTIKFGLRYVQQTMTWFKPKAVYEYDANYDFETYARPASFHLMFKVDKVIPTMHFPFAHIDVIGNKENSLRYYKNKVSNGLPIMDMNDAIWDSLMEYIEERRSDAYQV